MPIFSNPYTTITARAARKSGYYPLAGPYSPDEYPMLERVLTLLKKGPGKIDFEFVNETDNDGDVSIWRKSNSQ